MKIDEVYLRLHSLFANTISFKKFNLNLAKCTLIFLQHETYFDTGVHRYHGHFFI